LGKKAKSKSELVEQEMGGETSPMEELEAMEASFLAPIALDIRERLRRAATTGDLDRVPELMMRMMAFRVGTATTVADERQAVRMYAALHALTGKLAVMGGKGAMRKNEADRGDPELAEIRLLAVKAGVVDAG
jgi:hypothetical protein